MKAVESIKNQVSAIIVFKSESFDELSKEYRAIRERIDEGIARMEASEVFNENEIKEIKEYATGTLYRRQNEAHRDLRKIKRANFEF